MAEAEVIDSGQDRSKSIVVIMVTLSFLVVVLTPLAVMFAFNALSGTTGKDSSKKNYYEITLKEQTVNIAGTNGTRFIKFQLTLHYSDSGMAPYFDEKNAVGGLTKIIDSHLIEIVSSKNLTTLDSKHGKIQLNKEVKISLNDILRKYTDTSGMVTEIFFSQYLIQ